MPAPDGADAVRKAIKPRRNPKYGERELEAAQLAAFFYHERGFNPLPSDPETRHPLMRTYVRERDHGIRPHQLESWWAPNIQIALGRHWDLCLLDVDGLAGLNWLIDRVEDHGPLPPTWIIQTPRCGWHFWFAWPVVAPEAEIRVHQLWKGSGDHEGVELLGDGRLAMAPPSYRILDDGECRVYSFVAGQSPYSLPRPAPLPGWVLGLVPPPPPALPPPPPKAPPKRVRVCGRYGRGQVQRALTPEQRLEIAVRSGLRVVSRRPNLRGWITCKSPYRDDKHPSGRFHPGSGVYTEQPGAPVTVRFFDLLVTLGAYCSWQDAVNDLGRQLHLNAGGF